MHSDKIFHFGGGNSGQWAVKKFETVSGEPLSPVSHLKIIPASLDIVFENEWVLTGVKSNIRYANKNEKIALQEVQQGLGRSEAICAALIPIKKSDLWWNLAQDERRIIMEEQSGHISEGMKYLPAIARQLYHCRDIGEPFDFLTWFEYAPEHSNEFEKLVGYLRKSPEWNYVEREIDIRLIRY